MITTDELAALASIEAWPVVSIYLPTHVKGREIRQDPIRLKNALAAVTEELLAAGQRRPDVDTLLNPAQGLIGEEMFWRHQGHGLAIFAAPGLFQRHRLPDEVAEGHFVGPRPHIKPLLPLLADDGHFYCLAISAGETQLYEGSRYGFAAIDADLPVNVGEITAETDYENMRHAAPQARPRQGAPVGMQATYNFGEDPEEQRHAQLIEYLRRVHNALDRHLGGTQAPVVLVGGPQMQGYLRSLPSQVRFVEQGVEKDPGALSPEEIHALAYEIVRPIFAQRREQALDRFRMLAGSGDVKGATDLRTIVSAARGGRVDTLFVAEGEPVWGRYDAARDTVQLDQEATPENEDLTDSAAIHSLLNGGFVQVLPRAEMPRETAMCAILRY